MKKVIIVDDHALFRTGFEMILSKDLPDYQVVASLADGAGLINWLKKYGSAGVDLVWMDLDMEFMDGLTATKKLKDEWPDLPVIILTMHLDKFPIMRSIKAGCDGYLLKASEPEEVAIAAETVLNGGTYFPEAVLEELKKINPHYVFSERQIEVLQLLAKGLTAKAIGQMLFISETTVKSHRINLLNKAGVDSTAELLVIAAKEGLV